MKKVFLSLAFVLIGSFAFANDEVVIENSTKIENNHEISFKSKKVDFNSFTEIIQKGSAEIEATNVVKKPIVKLFLDDCGEIWLFVIDDSQDNFETFQAISLAVFLLSGGC